MLRNITLRNKEGAVAHLKKLLEPIKIKEGDWILIRVVNKSNNNEVIFPFKVRSEYRINIWNILWDKLGIEGYGSRTQFDFEYIRTLPEILCRGENLALDKNFELAQALPPKISKENNAVFLITRELDENRIVVSFSSKRPPTPVILNKIICLDSVVAGSWRAEGAKYEFTRQGFQFTNGDALAVKRVLDFCLTLGLSLEDSRWSFDIEYVFPKKDVEKEKTLKEYWSDKLGVPKDYFKTYWKFGDDGFKYGCLILKFNSSTFNLIIRYLFEAFEKSLCETRNPELASKYMAGTLGDANVVLRNNKSLQLITWSVSSENEARLYEKILKNNFDITTNCKSDKRGYWRVDMWGWDNMYKFISNKLYEHSSWNSKIYRNKSMRLKTVNKLIIGFLSHQKTLMFGRNAISKTCGLCP